MSGQTRALLIGVLGPALLAAGVGWVLLKHGVALGTLRHITFTDVVSGPAPLLIVTGLLVTAVCTQVALDVGAASQEEIETLTERHPTRESEVGIERAKVFDS